MNRFEGKTVLVTGGNSGMGLATAQAFAAEGARVIVTGRDTATLEAARPTLGANALAIQNEAGTVAAARCFAKDAAASPARFPKTRRSESELPPRRFAPWRPQATSPAAKRPSSVDDPVSASTRTPPMV